MLIYLIVAMGINLWKFNSIHHDGKELISHGFDAATFAASVAVLYGIVNPEVLKLLGSTKPFLMIGGIAGTLYSVGALWPKNGK